MNLDTMESQKWRVRLPSDWHEEGGALEDTLHFRSSDGTKGLYICTLVFENERRTVEEILGSIARIEIESNKKMDNGRWKILKARRESTADVLCWRIDTYDESNNYRIQGKLLGRLPTVVRASFYDYRCEDLEESSRLLEPIISSLELR